MSLLWINYIPSKIVRKCFGFIRIYCFIYNFLSSEVLNKINPNFFSIIFIDGIEHKLTGSE